MTNMELQLMMMTTTLKLVNMILVMSMGMRLMNKMLMTMMSM